MSDFPILHFNEKEIMVLILIVFRCSAFIVTWPLSIMPGVPNLLKILFSLILGVILFPIVWTDIYAHPDALGLSATKTFGDAMIWLVIKEVFVGICIGFMCRAFMFAMSVGGHLISTFLGLSNGQIFNPALGSQSTPVEQFYSIVCILLLLTLNGHHIWLDGLARSFTLVPVLDWGPKVQVFRDLVSNAHEILKIGAEIASPIMVTMFMVNMLMGILGRTVPQINVLVTSLPVNILLGLMMMIASLPALVPESERVINGFAQQMFLFMRAL